MKHKTGTDQIKLTPAQASCARWAIEAVDAFGPQDFADLEYQAEDAPSLRGLCLEFKPGISGAQAAADMVYRVDVQLSGVASDELYGNTQNRAGRNLARKIRAAYADRFIITDSGELVEVVP